MSEGTLDDRVAVVTGGAQGIGAAIADGLAAAGARVIVGDLRDSVRHRSMALDVSDEASVIAFIEAVMVECGRLDVVVNNAGIMFETNVAEQDRSAWDRMLAINLTGPMLMTKHGAPHLADGDAGAIVNVGSIEGDVCNPAHAAYAASKAGVHGLTRASAVDLGPLGVRCNAVAPGWIDTELNSSYISRLPDREQVVAELSRLHPLGRIGDTSDVADVVVWLAGPASRFVTGQIITVDGGRTSRPSLPGSLY